MTRVPPYPSNSDLKTSLSDLMNISIGLRGRARPMTKPCSLAAFAQEFWPVLEPDVSLVWGWYHDEICRHLEAVSDGLIHDLIINIPPRFSKSTLAAVMWPCWEWTYRPSRKFLFSSYGADLSERDSLKCRRLIRSGLYQSRFGDRFEIGAHRDLKDTTIKFENSRGGYRLATSVTGITTGEGADTLVVDDPIKAEDGNSETRRNQAIRWWAETMSSRLNDVRTGAKVLIMQRLHEQDLSGYWLSNGRPEHLCFPMEYEVDLDPNGDPVPRTTVLGVYDHRTTPGELLCPERVGPEELVRLRDENTEYSWAGQYQQRPAPRGGGMFRLDKIELVPAIPSTARLLRCRAWDRASTAAPSRVAHAIQGTRSAYTAGVLMAIDVTTNTVYIEDMVRGQWSTDAREAVTLATAEHDGRTVVIVLEQEPGSAGVDSVKATARMLSGYTALADRVTGGKDVRADPLATQIAFGNVKIVTGPWDYHALLREMESFPAGRYRDQCDACTMAFNFLSQRAVPARRAVSTPPPALFVPR
jgi:predicted phage terminase large subunit-like protein